MRSLAVIGPGQRRDERKLLGVRRVGDVDREEAATLAGGIVPRVQVRGVLVDRHVRDLVGHDLRLRRVRLAGVRVEAVLLGRVEPAASTRARRSRSRAGARRTAPGRATSSLRNRAIGAPSRASSPSRNAADAETLSIGDSDVAVGRRVGPRSAAAAVPATPSEHTAATASTHRGILEPRTTIAPPHDIRRRRSASATASVPGTARRPRRPVERIYRSAGSRDVGARTWRVSGSPSPGRHGLTEHPDGLARTGRCVPEPRTARGLTTAERLLSSGRRCPLKHVPATAIVHRRYELVGVAAAYASLAVSDAWSVEQLARDGYGLPSSLPVKTTASPLRRRRRST